MSDLISRQAAIDAIEAEKIAHGQYLTSSYVGYNMAEKVVKQLPPIQPRREERKIGEWIYDWGDWDFETCKCSECGNHITTPIGKRYSFCPNCGAKMEVNNESN